MRKGNKPRLGHAPSLDRSPLGDPRDRKSQAAGLGEGDILAPLTLVNGKLTIAFDRRGPLTKSAQGTIVLNIGDYLEVATGSPPRLNVVLPDIASIAAQVTEEILEARSSADISYSETLVASHVVGDEAPILYNADGTDIVTSEVLY